MPGNSRLTQQNRANSVATQVEDGFSEGQASCLFNGTALGKSRGNSGSSSRNLDRAGCDD